MKYYKVLKDGKIIDVLDHIHYLKYNQKHNRMFNATICDAEAILSSDEEHVWHVRGLKRLPVKGYDTVELEEIDVYEYKQLKALDGKTPEEIIDNFLLLLVEEGII